MNSKYHSWSFGMVSSFSSLPFMCGIQWYFQSQSCPVNTISCPIISRSFSLEWPSRSCLLLLIIKFTIFSQIHKFFPLWLYFFRMDQFYGCKKHLFLITESTWHSAWTTQDSECCYAECRGALSVATKHYWYWIFFRLIFTLIERYSLF
jgi:hypothetical protein